MTEPEIKPCPFCGNSDCGLMEGEPRPDMTAYAYVRCGQCRTEGPVAKVLTWEDNDEAIRLWNERVEGKT